MRRLLLAALIAAVLLLLWRFVGLDTFKDAFRSVAWAWLGLALALNAVSAFVRAVTWWVIVRESSTPPHPRLGSVTSAFFVGLVANSLLPARLGDLVRAVLLSRHHPHRRVSATANLLGTMLAHHLLDLLALMTLVGYVVYAASLPPWARTGLLALVGAGVVGLIAAVLLARSEDPGPDLRRLRRLWQALLQGLAVMRRPLAAATATALQLGGWLIQLAAVYATMRAFAVDVDEMLPVAAMVLVLVNVALAFPLWPGNVGLVQAAVALPLVAYGVSYTHGFAFGIGLQASEVLVALVLGLLAMGHQGLSLASLRTLADEARDEQLAP